MDDIEAKFHALHAWIDREEAHSRYVIGNAKLVSTFSATLAATLFVAAVADTKNHCADVISFVLLVFAVGLTLVLVAMKRKKSVGFHTIETTTADSVPPDAIAAAEKNKERADVAHTLLFVQIFLSLVSCGFAIVPILGSVS